MLVVAVLVVGRTLVPASTPASAADGHAAMDLSLAQNPGSTPATTPNPTPRPTALPLVATSIGRAVVDDAIPYLGGYRWPVEHARITQGFGPSSAGLFTVDGERFHDGIDIANFCGAPILAAHDGMVIAAGRHVVTALGWTGDTAAYDAYYTSKNLWASAARIIVIDDGNGYRSVYIHMHRIDVQVGQLVKAGQQIGLEGNSGHATGCHLHYSIYSPTDPTIWETTPSEATTYHLPSGEIARVDPLVFLPPLAAGWITWGWGSLQPQD